MLLMTAVPDDVLRAIAKWTKMVHRLDSCVIEHKIDSVTRDDGTVEIQMALRVGHSRYQERQ